MPPLISICLTVHNKGHLLKRVLDGIYNNASDQFQFIILFDSCVDDSEMVWQEHLRDISRKINYISEEYFPVHIRQSPERELFETKANNTCAKVARGKYLIFFQDDCIITEPGYDKKMLRPFEKYNDVFAVSGNCSHGWKINPDSIDIQNDIVHGERWCDILIHEKHANSNTIQDDNFHVRSSVNRGPLMISRADFETLGGFPETLIDKQDMDDHILMFDARQKLNKVCGYVKIQKEENLLWGGTRDANGKTKEWLLRCQNKNTRAFCARHKDNFEKFNIVETRPL